MSCTLRGTMAVIVMIDTRASGAAARIDVQRLWRAGGPRPLVVRTGVRE
jgi:hypothetical protein